jgi:hypothetical protein
MPRIQPKFAAHVKGVLVTKGYFGNEASTARGSGWVAILDCLLMHRFSGRQSALGRQTKRTCYRGGDFMGPAGCLDSLISPAYNRDWKTW